MASVHRGYIIPTTMETLDPAGEFLRMAEWYRQMSDAELVVLAGRSSELTEVAQQALAGEISRRRLKVEVETVPARLSPEPAESSDDPAPYSEELKLVELCTVWSLADALQVQTLLDRAGIPFFMGPEKATGVDAVTSNCINGVSVKIMQIGLPWARQAMEKYTPANEPPRKYDEEPAEIPVRCPKCQSTEVVFEGLSRERTGATENSCSKYKWTCDSCGCRWEDDGVAVEG